MINSVELYAGVCTDNKLYCMEKHCNAVLSIDLDSAYLDYRGSLTNEEAFMQLLSTNAEIWKKKIIYIPYYARCVHLYDMEDGTDSIIQCNEENFQRDKYSIVFWDNDKCYMLPFIGDFIWEIDIERQKISRKMNIRQNLMIQGVQYDVFSVCDVYQYGNVFYVAMYDQPYIIEINLRQNIVYLSELTGLQGGIMSITGSANKLYLLSRGKSVIIYSLNEKKIEKSCNLNVDLNIFLTKATVFNGHVYFTEVARQDFLDYDIENNKAVYSDFVSEWGIKDAVEEQFRFVCVEEETKVILISDRLKLVIYDLITNRINSRVLRYDKKNMKHKMAEIYEHNSSHINYEYNIWNFSVWMECSRIVTDGKQNRDIGAQIWGKLRGQGE